MAKKRSTRSRRSRSKKNDMQKVFSVLKSFFLYLLSQRKKFSSYVVKKTKPFRKKHEDVLELIKKFCTLILGFGFIINYALHFLLGVKFTLLTFPAWGILYYFVKDEFLEWFRRIVAKR